MIAALLAALARAIAGGTVRWAAAPSEDRQRVFFANHTSHLDFILIWASLPARVRRRARPVAAQDYWESGPIRRYLARWEGKVAIRSGTARIAIVPRWDDDVPLKDGLPEFPGSQVLLIIPEQESEKGSSKK